MASDHYGALPIGTVLEHYRLESVLGHGGFGITYQALEVDLERPVAIKEYLPREVALRDQGVTVMPISEADRDLFNWGLERFQEEARTLARFQHPNIVSVRRFIRAHGTAYLVMDYCDGESLEAVLKREGTLSTERLIKLWIPLLNALETLHASEVTHRDIKPANIYLRRDGSPVLLDFGAARQALAQHSRSVTSMATPGYAAFEQYSSRGQQGPWTDIYGLGATLYRCVTGKRPVDATDRMIDDDLVSTIQAARRDYPRVLLEQIDAALRLRPRDRPQSVAAWRRIGKMDKALGLDTGDSLMARARQAIIYYAYEPLVAVLGDRQWIGLVAILAAFGFFIWLISDKPFQSSDSEPGVTPTAVVPPATIDTTGPPPAALQELQDNMLTIPGGSFQMGCLAERDHNCFDQGGPARTVTVSSFKLGRYPVTFAQWDACVADGACTHRPNDEGWGRDRHPVMRVSFDDITRQFLPWLRQRTGHEYRLPSEAEWEYACRAGENHNFCGSDHLDEVAWFRDNSDTGQGRRTQAVGGKAPNAFGLYDMNGNVWEWTQDCRNTNYQGAPNDGSAWTSGDCSRRVLRGGSWDTYEVFVRAAFGVTGTTSDRGNLGGFRVARSL